MEVSENTVVGNNLDSAKNEVCKQRHRKFTSINDEVISEGTEKAYKKKKFVNDSFPVKVKVNKKIFRKYKNTNDYTKVVAKPETLPAAPKIFQSTQYRNYSNNFSIPFIQDFLTNKCIDIDIKNRFTYIAKSGNWQNAENKTCKQNLMPMELCSNNQDEVSSAEKDKNNAHSHNISQKKEKQKKFPKVNESINSDTHDSSYINDKETRNHVDIYKIHNKKALVFHLHHPCLFSFHGELKLTVISGEIEILGFTSSHYSNLKTIDAYSPNLFTPLVIQSKVPKESKSYLEIKGILEDMLMEDDINQLLSNIKADDSVVYIEQVSSTFGMIINKYFAKPIFPKDLENISSLSKSLKDLQSTFNFKPSKKFHMFRKNPMWDSIPLSHCTVICGGKGVGKSTLLRYYVNKLVVQGEKILVLDFDPGQPEFTPPGCLSAVIVNKPLLGPNFTHLIDPELMLYFGGVDVCQGPARYLECVKYIIDHIRNNEELLHMTWFVNTMGFSKGLGVGLMISILKLIQPNTVIQIKSFDHKSNYPFYLSSTTVNSKKGYPSMVLDEVYLNFDLRVIRSCAERKKKILQSGLKPKELREIMLVSYFSRMVSPPYFNFNAVQPHIISFSKLYLGIDFIISPNDILKAFNGSLVSFSNFEPGSEEILTTESDNSYFKIVVKPNLTPSLAIGFVRGIDCNEKKFYVITHLSLEELDNVNFLYLGRISPPSSMFLKQDSVEGQTYYTSVTTVDAVQRVKRMFRVPANQINK